MTGDTFVSSCMVSGIVGAAAGYLVGRVEGYRRCWAFARDLAHTVEDARQNSRQCLADALEAAAPVPVAKPFHADRLAEAIGSVSETSSGAIS